MKVKKVKVRGLIIIGGALTLMNTAILTLHLFNGNAEGIISAVLGLVGSTCLIAAGFILETK